MCMTKNNYSDIEHLEFVARRIAESGADITSEYQDWISVTFACASMGEAARESYHTICSQYSGYKREECDKCFDNCLRTGRGDITLGTIIKLAKERGIDTSLPRGPRRKTKQERQEERENRFMMMRQSLEERYCFRFNTWKNRVEIKAKTNTDTGANVSGGFPAGISSSAWAPLTDRDLSTLFSELLEQGLSVKLNDLKALLESRKFSMDYDAVNSWLKSLKSYDPDNDPDYLADFFNGHLCYDDAEHAEFYQEMLQKWFVGMVALWTGRTDENPIMPVFCGSQHIGKTYFIRHLLPPQLRQYYKEPSPRDPVDKDFIISLSEVVMIFLDEFSISSNLKSDTYKAIITSNQSNLRDAFARYREVRHRKASLIGATNYQQFIRDSEGNRRYVGIALKATANLGDHPLPYEGAYAQALWLLDNGFNPKPSHEDSEAITRHNRDFMESNDCEEALMVFLRHPDDDETPEAYTAGELMQELNSRGFHGQSFNAVNVGKSMKHLGFSSFLSKGKRRYLVVIADYDRQKRERATEGADNDDRPF